VTEGASRWPIAPLRHATRGIVASASHVAAAVAVRVLQDGGNAADAAVAAALVEGVTLPASCGLGGDAFMVVYEARTDAVHAINGAGAAPVAATREAYLAGGHATMPLTGPLSAAVPGAPDAYWTLHRRFGSLPWPEVVAPAVRCAEEGVPLSGLVARHFSLAGSKLGRFSESAAYLAAGASPQAGDLLRLPQYARTLRALAEGGPDTFYRGETARELVRALRAAGGLFEEADLAAHTTDCEEPIHTTYRGVGVYTNPPPSQGMILLEHLNLLEGFDLAAGGFGTAETLHLMAETKKLAFEDRLRYAGDPRLVAMPLGQLLSKEYAAQRRREVDPNRAADVSTAPESAEGDTSYLCVVDEEGNAVSLIHSLSAAFGSGFVAGETGVLLNNRAGRGFTLEEGHPNVLAGGKRTMSTLHCYALVRDGALYAVGGTEGGDQQPQWNAQVICNLVDFGMDPQAALAAPRWYSFPGTDPANTGRPVELRLESRFPPGVAESLARRGHQVVDIGPWGTAGAYQLIVRRPDGVLLGATDPRTGGIALGF
jgi:gamma-glutamyltranspeptidase / glutathione hydrolase